MADFNINANFSVNPHGRNYTTAPTSVSFHAAQACVVTFTPTNNCFGSNYPSLSLATGATVTVPVVASIATTGTAGASARAAVAGAGTSIVGDPNPDVFDITFGSEPK